MFVLIFKINFWSKIRFIKTFKSLFYKIKFIWKENPSIALINHGCKKTSVWKGEMKNKVGELRLNVLKGK